MSDNLQFDQAEFGNESKARSQACSACNGPLVGQYFLANDQVVCEGCADKIKSLKSEGSPARRFGVATVLGLIAGALGAGLYFGIAVLTGYEFGLVAIVVGFAVGYAVRMGSGGRGGKPYQLLAVFITYSAIVCTYVPSVVEGFNLGLAQAYELETDPEKIAKLTVTREQTVLLNGNTISIEALDAELERISATGGQAWYHREGMQEESSGVAADQVAESIQKNSLAFITFADPGFRRQETWTEGMKRAEFSRQLVAAGFVFGIAASAPFYGLPENIIGLLIIGFALFQAWRSNALAVIDIKGPLKLAELPNK